VSGAWDIRDRRITIFEGLNEIPWADLTRAYGSAEEVPMWLRQLTSADSKVRHIALNHLWGSICHQNWICPATGYAVPYLIELLQMPGVRGKDQILDMLADIVSSSDTLDEATWRANADVPQWNVPTHIPFKDARAEAAAGIPVYSSLLEDADPKVRMQAAHVLSSFPGHTAGIRPALLLTLAHEGDERARANLVMAIGRVAAELGDIALFGQFMAPHESPLVRFAAALALTHLAKEAAPQEAVAILADVMRRMGDMPRPLAAYEKLPCGGGWASSAAMGMLRELEPRRLGFTVPLLLDMLGSAQDLLDLASIARMLLFALLGGDPEDERAPVPATAIPADLHAALSILLDRADVWTYINFRELLRAYGLPDSRERMAIYLGRDPTDRPRSPSQEKDDGSDDAGLLADHSGSVLVFTPQNGTADEDDDEEQDPFERYIERIREAYPELRTHQYEYMYGPPGQNNETITANERYIFRFPKHPRAVEEMAREIALLRALQGRLPLSVPNPIYSSIEPREVGQAFMGYAKLPGKPLYREMLESVPGEETVAKLAAQLGGFLRALHALPPDAFDFALPVAASRETWTAMYANIRERLFPRMRPDARERVAAHFEPYLADARNFGYSPALIHGDFGPSNILYDARARSIGGIIDWSGAGLGDPSNDIAALIGLMGYGEDFARRLESVYPGVADMLPRARFYAGTFALQEALFGLETGDAKALAAGLAEYV